MKNLHDWIIGLATKLDALVGARVQNVYHVECRDGDGNLKWEEDIGNTVTTEGLADLLTKYFKGSSYNAAWYMGLKGTGSIVAGDTLALHFWVEVKLKSRWLPIDPTFDQAPASAFRVKLGTTDLANLASVGWDSAAQVFGPTLPSASRPFAFWNSSMASLVIGPSLPSTVPV